MKKNFLVCLVTCLTLMATTMFASDSTHVQFKYEPERINEKEAILTVKAIIQPGIKLYGLQQSHLDMLYTNIIFDTASSIYLSGATIEKGIKQSEHDTAINVPVSFFRDTVLWQQRIKIADTDSALIKGHISYMYKKGEEYIPGEDNFKFYIKANNANKADHDVANRSLIWIFNGVIEGDNPSALPKPQKYYDEMKKNEPDVVVNNGMVTYFDYKEALEAARKVKKPLMIDFTGINCINCRKMEGQVWSDPKVMQRLKENFVIASLYVDVHNVFIPDVEQYYSNALNKQVEKLGDLNADMQVTRFGANTQPYYFFLDSNEQRLVQEGYGYDPDINKFIGLLDKVKDAYQNAASVNQ